MRLYLGDAAGVSKRERQKPQRQDAASSGRLASAGELGCGGMRRGIPDRTQRDATITLSIAKRPFDAALGIASEREITLLLVKPDGAVPWRATGKDDLSKTAGLVPVLALLEKAQSPPP